MSNPRQPKADDTDDAVVLMGLDFGSTTSSALVARARIDSNFMTGQMEFGDPQVTYRSEPVFTPFDGDTIDADRVGRYMDQWLEQGAVRSDDIFAGGAIITGLAAKRRNSAAVARLVRERFGESVIATADDPCLESWLTFMASSSVLSRCHHDTPIINLDIGGGTTNPALGIDGDVLRTGCYYIGARHFQFLPGTYDLTAMSEWGRRLLEHLGFRIHIGDRLSGRHLDGILDFYRAALEAIVTGDSAFFSSGVGEFHEQIPLNGTRDLPPAAVTFSGGVGELIYRHQAGDQLPGTTYYGDLGIDLALRIVASPILSKHLDTFVPENRGRATVYGLTLHSTEVSGTTLFLPRPDTLPLRDLPVVGRLAFDAGSDKIREALSLAKRSRRGACIQVVECAGEPPTATRAVATPASFAGVKALGSRLAAGLRDERFPPDYPLVILTPGNTGKTIGNYTTNWGKASFNVLVIDEVPSRDAHFVNIGTPHHNVVPVSFYGMR